MILTSFLLSQVKVSDLELGVQSPWGAISALCFRPQINQFKDHKQDWENML